MGRIASARKLSAASAIDAAEAALEERSVVCPRPDSRAEKTEGEAELRSILSECKHALPDGYQDEIRAHLEAELDAGATLYGRRRDGAYVARTKSGDRLISRPSEDV